jgi:hypothetical protein
MSGYYHNSLFWSFLVLSYKLKFCEFNKKQFYSFININIDCSGKIGNKIDYSNHNITIYGIIVAMVDSISTYQNSYSVNLIVFYVSHQVFWNDQLPPQ